MDVYKTIVSDEEVYSIFGNIFDLLLFHTKFLGLFKEKYQYLTPSRFMNLITRQFNCMELYKLYGAASRQIDTNKDNLEIRYPQLKHVIQVFKQ